MRFTVQEYRAVDSDLTEDNARAQAWSMLSEKCVDAGLAMDGGVRPSEPEPVIVRPDYSGWDPCPEGAEPTGHVIEWWCEAVEPIRDPDPEPGGAYDDGVYTVEVPDDHRLLPVHGGPVRVRHNLGGPVTITATMREGHTGNGILISTPISDDEEHVEVLPGVASLHVVRDPEDDDAQGT